MISQSNATLQHKVSGIVPTACDIGGKKGSSGETKWWRGYKLHLDVADGNIPISALITAASVHDSQVAIPLIHMTSGRVTYLYDVMDSASMRQGSYSMASCIASRLMTAH